MRVWLVVRRMRSLQMLLYWAIRTPEQSLMRQATAKVPLQGVGNRQDVGSEQSGGRGQRLLVSP